MNHEPSWNIEDAAREAAAAMDNVDDLTGQPLPEHHREGSDQWKAQAEANLAGWQRAQADYANFKRRSEQEIANSWGSAQADLARRLLPALDDLERALAAAPAEVAGNSWFGGLQGVNKNIQTAFTNAGITEIVAVGQPFDPNLHEAVSTEAGQRDVVIQVFRKGYRFKDQLLRAAMVTVGEG